MIYIDSSSLLKILWPEAESIAVLNALKTQSMIVISQLTELETLVQLKAARLGGDYTKPQWRRFETRLQLLRHQPPFEFRDLSGTLFQTALRQHRNSQTIHCRTLDRLHLAAMEELEIKRLMTHDDRQARAAREAGYDVVQPGRSRN